jgi:hypothetical protein
LPVPTIVITVITIVNILTGLHRLQSESNTQRRDHPRSRLSLLCIPWKGRLQDKSGEESLRRTCQVGERK